MPAAKHDTPEANSPIQVVEKNWLTGIDELGARYEANLHSAFDNDVYQISTEDLFTTFIYNYIMQHRGGSLIGVAPALCSEFEALMVQLSPELLCKLRLMQGITVVAPDASMRVAS